MQEETKLKTEQYRYSFLASVLLFITNCAFNNWPTFILLSCLLTDLSQLLYENIVIKTALRSFMTLAHREIKKDHAKAKWGYHGDAL